MITTIATPRRLRIAGFAAGAAALAGAAVYITASAASYNLTLNRASNPEPAAMASAPDAKGGAASAACTNFITHFASDLKTNQAAINNAYQQAIGQTLADEVKNGDLTQAQADKIKQALAGKQPCALANGLAPAVNAGPAQYTQALLTAAAAALGITPEQLRTDLASGMTLSQVAAAQKPAVTEDQFRTKLIAGIRPLLDKAVSDKTLTSAQEQQILKRLQAGPIPYWDKPMKKAAAA